VSEPMPEGLLPMLATAGALPGRGSWGFEFKWDFCARIEPVGQPVRRRRLRGVWMKAMMKEVSEPM